TVAGGEVHHRDGGGPHWAGVAVYVDAHGGDGGDGPVPQRQVAAHSVTSRSVVVTPGSPSPGHMRTVMAWTTHRRGSPMPGCSNRTASLSSRGTHACWISNVEATCVSSANLRAARLSRTSCDVASTPVSVCVTDPLREGIDHG